MNVLGKIECMIILLEVAKEELNYAYEYKSKEKDNNFTYNKRLPNGTLIRENLKTVSRLARLCVDEVLLTPYSTKIEKNDLFEGVKEIHERID